MSFHVLELGPIPPPEGGVSRNIAALKAVLEARGHKCTLVATTRNAANDQHEGNVYPQSPLDLISTLRESDAAIFHLHIGGDISMRVLALALAVAKIAKHSVLTVHSGGFPDAIVGATIFRRKFTASILKKFDRVIAVSEKISDAICELGVPSHRIETIPPYALQLPDPNVRLDDSLNDFLLSHSPILAAVGALEPEYAPLEQVEALKILKGDLPKIGLVIAGDGSMRDEVVDAVSDADLADNIFLSGNINHDRILHLIKRADVSLRTTHFDGDAISVRESLFLGTPVLATREGTRPDGVHFVEELTPEAIADGVREVLALPRKESGSSGDDLSQIERVVGVYEELIGS